MTHPSTTRRRERAAQLPPKTPGRKPGPEGPRVSLTVRVPPSVKARLEAEAAARGIKLGALIEALAATLPS